MTAIENPASVSGQPGIQARRHRIDERSSMFSRVSNQRSAQSSFHTFEFFVERSRSDRDVVVAGLIGGVDGRLDFQNNVSHEVDQRREEQLFVVLFMGRHWNICSIRPGLSKCSSVALPITAIGRLFKNRSKTLPRIISTSTIFQGNPPPF